MANSKIAYFSMADPSVAGLADETDFNRSLILNLLFQEQILITDVYFFSSPYIKNHILDNEKGQSIIRAGVKHGFVIPAFRDERSTFTATLSRIKQTNIKGVLEDIDRVAKYLQNAADANQKFKPVFWPEYSVGVEFAKLANKYLGRKNPLPVGGNSNISSYTAWKLSEKWRIELIQNAIESAPNPTRDGLRRGDLYSLIAKELGSKNIKDIQPIDLIKLTTQGSKEREAARIFCTWINTLYQYNQAVHFSASTNFPSYDLTITTLSKELIGQDFSEKGNDIFELKTDLTIEKKIYLPSIKEVNQVDAEEIMKMRNNSGERYFTDLEEWQKNPTDVNKRAVIKSIEMYNKELKKCFSKSGSGPGYLVDVFLQANPLSKAVIAAAFSFLTSAVSYKAGLPYIPLLIQFGTFGIAIYNWKGHSNNYTLTLKTKSKTQNAEINAPRSNT